MTRSRRLVCGAALAGAASFFVGGSSAQPPDPGWGSIPHCHTPDVRRLQLAVAKRKLRAALCGVGLIYRRHSSLRKGRVFLQVPEAGSQLAPRTEVDLFVSKGPRPH